MNLAQLTQSRMRYWPAELFRDGSIGAFLVVDNVVTTRFQNAAGTTLATADTDPLGLIYDLKNGVPVLGAELVTNGDFSGGSTGWTTEAGVSITGGKAAFTGSGRLFQTLPVYSVGKHYSVTFSVDCRLADSVRVSVGGSYVNISVALGVSIKTAIVYADSGATGLYIRTLSATPNLDIDNISVKELPGSHAYQTTTTARPLLASSPKRAVFDNVDDRLNVYFSGGLTDATVVREYTGIGYQYDAGRTMLPNHVINTDFSRYVVRQGSLTAAEQAALEAYLGNNRKFMILKSADTTINNLMIYTSGALTLLLFVGANGATVTKSLSLNSLTNYDVSTDGLTAPVFVVFPKSLVDNTALLHFYCYSNQLTGSIPSLTTNTDLSILNCHTNRLTGSIPSLTTNTNLTQFYCTTNQLTGSIPSLTTNTALTIFNCSDNQLTGSIPSLTTNTNLTTFYCTTNQLTGSIPSLTTNTNLSTFYCYSNQLTGSIPSLTTNTYLTTFRCESNQLTGWDGGTVPATLGDFRANDNLLPQSAVDGLLAAFVAAGKATGTRILYIGGTGNAAPSAAGLADKAILESRGWSVITN